MDNPTPALARGQTKDLYRGVEEKLLRGIDNLIEADRRSTPENWYRHVTKEIEKSHRDLIVAYTPNGLKGKKAECLYVMMQPDAQVKGRITVVAIEVKAHPPVMNITQLPVCVTRHCVERIFQRQKIQDIDSAIEVIKDMFVSLSELNVLQHPEKSDIELLCEEGMYLGEVIDGVAVIKTFVDIAKLRPEQKSPTT